MGFSPVSEEIYFKTSQYFIFESFGALTLANPDISTCALATRGPPQQLASMFGVATQQNHGTVWTNWNGHFYRAATPA